MGVLGGLPTRDDLKAYLRITTVSEDELIDRLLENARGFVENYIQRPIELTQMTFTDEADSLRAYDRVTKLQTPIWPIQATSSTSVAISDADDNTVSTSTYRVNAPFGQIIARPGFAFEHGPYTITCFVGLEAAPDYDTRVRPLVFQALLDTAAELYTNRTPGTTYESAGGGVAVAHVDRNPIPPRVRLMLDNLRPVGVGS